MQEPLFLRLNSRNLWFLTGFWVFKEPEGPLFLRVFTCGRTHFGAHEIMQKAREFIRIYTDFFLTMFYHICL